MNDLRLIGIGMNMLLGMLLMACSSIPVREAEEVVSQADSLWHEGKMYGIDEGDSATLAQAYETLKAIPLPFRGEGLCPIGLPVAVRRTSSGLGSSFSHSCYHYGKLLRAKDDPVAAMQVFIDATHSHTDDYHILGRVYSNMGSICHLAGEFSLSYDMFERSANMFLQNGDTLLYYYLLNDMAFELAEQGKKEEAMSITNKIYENCRDEEVLVKALETQSIAYKKIQQYDSAIYYAHLLLNYNYNEPIGYLICAQAYSYKEKKDSAVFYAQKVLEKTNQLDEINNALYVLTNADETKVLEDVRQIAAYRSDVQKLLEIRQGKLSQAVQLLELDLTRKPDYRWLYAILITLIIIGVGICAYTSHKRRQHKLLSQEVDDMRHEKENLQEIHNQIVQEHNDYTGTLITQIQQNCIILRQSEDFPNNICWKEFNTMSKIINDNFGMLVQKLQKIYHLQEKEIRLCILVLFDTFNSKQQAKLLFYSESGIRNFKNRVAKKLGTNSTELRDFLISLAINEHSKCTQ